jgi:hypothetical protein
MEQIIDYCGVGAQHQNGIAERRIHSIVDRARTMLLHAIHRWPSTITTKLWPFALKLAVDLQNATPGITELTPQKIFTGTKCQLYLSNFNTFGCPVHVIEPGLFNGSMIPKWEP